MFLGLSFLIYKIGSMKGERARPLKHDQAIGQGVPLGKADGTELTGCVLWLRARAMEQDSLGWNAGPAGCPWTSGLISLGSIFLICKMETIIVNVSEDACEDY